jgi:hypothetical protein
MIDRLDAQSFDSLDTADDVENRVHCPHLVEMDLLGGNAMHSAFGFPDQLKGADGACLDPIGNRCALDKPHQLANVTTVGLLRNPELDLLAGDSGPPHVANRNAHIRYPEAAR